MTISKIMYVVVLLCQHSCAQHSDPCTQQQMVTLATCAFDCDSCQSVADNIFASLGQCMLIGDMSSRYGHLTAREAVLATCDIIVDIDPNLLTPQGDSPHACPVYNLHEQNAERTENWWDARNGTGSCDGLIASGRSCSEDFCATASVCKMHGYCDQSCGFCTSRQNMTLRECG